MKIGSKHTLLALASLLATAIPSQAVDILLLSDNFNTGDNTDLNQNLASRQDGTLESAGSNWTEAQGTANAISGNQLNVNNGAINSHVVNNADFEASLTSVDLSAVPGFIVAFKFDYTGAAGAWSSPYLSTHNAADERGNSRFGMVAFGNGDVQFYGGAVGGSQVGTTVTNATLSSLVSGWNITNQNSYSLVATRTTATTGTYDAFINGVEVASNIAYAFGTGGANGEVNFEVINIGNGAGLYDDLSITTVGGGGDITPPTLTSITDNVSGGPVTMGNMVTYTVTFSEDMNAGTVDASDFNNAGTAAVTIGSITETTPGVFTVQATPTSAGSLTLRIAGPVLQDTSANNLVVPLSDDTTITVQTAYDAWAGGALFDSDANADGVKSGLAWILGAANPNASALDKLPTVSTSAGNMVFTFKRIQASINATTALSIEVGTTLTSWPSVYTVGANTAGSTLGVEVAKDTPTAGTDTVTLTVLQSPDAAKFARLKAVQTP